MSDDAIRHHITACATRSDAETAGLAARFAGACWPGGADRTQPGALGWVRRWRPGRLEAVLPACSCAGGRCVVCN